MKKKNKKDRKRRYKVEKGWKERRRRKIKKEDRRSRREERRKAGEERKREGKDKDVSKTRVRNRCVETGGSRGVIRWYRRTGIQVRERGLKGKIPGRYKKAW